jgi:hypothetical protein
MRKNASHDEHRKTVTTSIRRCNRSEHLHASRRQIARTSGNSQARPRRPTPLPFLSVSAHQPQPRQSVLLQCRDWHLRRMQRLLHLLPRLHQLLLHRSVTHVGRKGRSTMSTQTLLLPLLVSTHRSRASPSDLQPRRGSHLRMLRRMRPLPDSRRRCRHPKPQHPKWSPPKHVHLVSLRNGHTMRSLVLKPCPCRQHRKPASHVCLQSRRTTSVLPQWLGLRASVRLLMLVPDARRHRRSPSTCEKLH